MISTTIVVPSYNQADYLRACLDSIVNQPVPIELIVVDGGSTDGSVEVIHEFEDKIAWWVSEPDNGQTDAINKGLKTATGDVWAYLNSDDLLELGSLDVIAKFFTDNADAEWLSGGCRVFGEDIDDWFLNPTGVINLREVLTPWDRSKRFVFPQSGACFMRRSVLERSGYFDPSYHYSMDIEYYTRAALKFGVKQHITDRVLAAWRWHPEAKSFQEGIAFAFREDEIRIAETYVDCLPKLEQRSIRRQLVEQKAHVALRRAMWFYESGQLGLSKQALFEAIKIKPSLACSRYWVGAARRILFARAKTA